MAYELFWQAVAAYQSSEDAGEQEACAGNLFASLFEHYPRFAEFHDYLTSPLALSPKLALGPNARIVEEFVEDEETDGAEAIGSMLILAGYPDHLPTQEMTDQLRRLEIPLSPYSPDSVEPIIPQSMRTAAFIHGASLFTSWLRTRWGDDLQPAQRELERLFSISKKFATPALVNDLLISLSERAAAQMAFIRRDYSAALKEIANSIKTFSRYINSLNIAIIEGVISDDLKDMVAEQGAMLYIGVAGVSVYAPWLTGGLADAKTYLRMVKQSNRDDLDWQAIVTACEVLSNAALRHRLRLELNPHLPPYRIDHSVFNITTEESAFWTIEKGYAEAQLTSDQLRSLYEGKEDEAARQRLRTYFFPGNLWEQLPQRAQQVLVSADRQMLTISEGYPGGVIIFLCIATEEILHRYLGHSVSEWEEKYSKRRENPSLGDFVQFLFANEARDNFRSIGLEKDAIDYLTKQGRMPKQIQQLQRERNKIMHEPGYTPDPHAIRALYAEALGVGRKGVLPEMLRLLAPRPKPTVR